MNAADVLQAAMYPYGSTPMASYSAHTLMAALLAHGEQGQGVTIEADGDLHPKDPPMTTRLPDGTLWALEFHGEDYGPGDGDVELFRLVPLSAEAGDTDGPIPSVPSTWMGGGLEITYGSAEAGDTAERCQWRPSPNAMNRCDLPEGHTGRHHAAYPPLPPLSAEAGDTDDA